MSSNKKNEVDEYFAGLSDEKPREGTAHVDVNRDKVEFNESRARMEKALGAVRGLLENSEGKVVGVKAFTWHPNFHGPTDQWNRVYLFNSLEDREVEEIQTGFKREIAADAREDQAKNQVWTYVYDDELIQDGGFNWDGDSSEISFEETDYYVGDVLVAQIQGELYTADRTSPLDHEREYQQDSKLFGQPVRTEHAREFFTRLQELFPVDEVTGKPSRFYKGSPRMKDSPPYDPSGLPDMLKPKTADQE